MFPTRATAGVSGAGPGIALDRIGDAIRASNQDVGGRTIELTETEYMIRGRGYLRGIDDLATVVLKTSSSGTPVLLRDVARRQDEQ